MTAVHKRPDCRGCPVQKYGVCHSIGGSEGGLQSIASLRHVGARTEILADGDCPDFFANIVSGVVKLTKQLSDGRRQIVGLLFAGDFLGRPFADKSPFAAESVGDVVLCCYRKAAFEGLLRAQPGIEHNLLVLILSELDAAHEWMVLLGRKSARERVASLLLLFARRIGRESNYAGQIGFRLPLSRMDIADCIGLCAETISRQIGDLRDAGVIANGGDHSITILDAKRLEALTDLNASQ